MKRLPYGSLKNIAEVFGISSDSLSGYLNGHRTVSRKRAILFSKKGRTIGLDLTESDWLFDIDKVRSAIAEFSEAA